MKTLVIVFLCLLVAQLSFAQKKEDERLTVITNVRVTPGTLPPDDNDKQDFTVKWDINQIFGARKFQSFQVEISIKRADNSTKSDTKQVNGNSREAVLKIKGNAAPVSATVKVTGVSVASFTCEEKFSGPNLSVNEPNNTINLGLIDILSITPLSTEEQKKKQTFDVKWKLPNGFNPANISKFKLDLVLLMDNQTKENDQKSPNPASLGTTMKVKSPGAPVQAVITASGESTITDVTTANLTLNQAGGFIPPKKVVKGPEKAAKEKNPADAAKEKSPEKEATEKD